MQNYANLCEIMKICEKLCRFMRKMNYKKQIVRHCKTYEFASEKIPVIK